MSSLQPLAEEKDWILHIIAVTLPQNREDIYPFFLQMACDIILEPKKNPPKTVYT